MITSHFLDPHSPQCELNYNLKIFGKLSFAIRLLCLTLSDKSKLEFLTNSKLGF